MFKSKIRALITPQYEHGKLAGALAAAWGNDDFARPALDFEPFVQGVTLHDWHYGLIDNLPIGGAAEADWLALSRQGVTMWFDDPITDIVAKLHLKRLLGSHDTPERQQFIAQVEARIEARLAETPFSRAQFEWADRITRFCDTVAFDFAFEQPVERTLKLYAAPDSGQETDLSYQIAAGGYIRVTPWPFAASHVSGLLIGYQPNGYPEQLTPQVIPYHCQPV